MAGVPVIPRSLSPFGSRPDQFGDLKPGHGGDAAEDAGEDVEGWDRSKPKDVLGGYEKTIVKIALKKQKSF